MKDINSALREIQNSLKAPKNQFNKFGNFSYRSCEDILEAVKPLLGDALLTISDELVNLGDRFYVKATATFSLGENKIEISAFAREEETKKGMDGSQITGSASSYARKYALNGLFLIDDNKDVDTQKQKPQKSKITVYDICDKITAIKTKAKIEEMRKWTEKSAFNQNQKNIIFAKLDEQEKVCE